MTRLNLFGIQAQNLLYLSVSYHDYNMDVERQSYLPHRGRSDPVRPYVEAQSGPG